LILKVERYKSWKEALDLWTNYAIIPAKNLVPNIETTKKTKEEMPVI
jgi:hypothetical protein